LLAVHKNEKQISDILLMPKRSEDRMNQLQLLANEGHFKHNTSVLKSGEGQLVLFRRTAPGEKPASKFLPCEYCKRFLASDGLWRHYRVCHARTQYYADHGSNPNAEESGNCDDSKVTVSCTKSARTMLNTALCDNTDAPLCDLLGRMRDDEVKDVILQDELIKHYALLRVESLGRKADQKIADMHRVSSSVRTLGRIVIEARMTMPDITLDGLITPGNFDLAVQIAKRLSVDKEKPALNAGRVIGHLLGHVAMIKSGIALRDNNTTKAKQSSGFSKRHSAEWNFRVNSGAVKRMNNEKRLRTPVIPITEDLVKLRSHVIVQMNNLLHSVASSHQPPDWLSLAKFTMSRLILFNKRRRAEVRDLKVEEYIHRPQWHQQAAGEMELALSATDRLLAKRLVASLLSLTLNCS
jgi:hypothetical protein